MAIIDNENNIPLHIEIDLQKQNYDRLRSASLFQITVRFKGILKSVSFPNSQIFGRFIG